MLIDTSPPLHVQLRSTFNLCNSSPQHKMHLPQRDQTIGSCDDARSDAERKHSLLNLPPELRNRIYEYVLVNRCLKITVSKEKHSQPPLLETCRQLREEASGIFYSQNELKMDVQQFSQGKELPKKHHWLWQKPNAKGCDIFVAKR